MELHRYLVELRVVFDHDSFKQLEHIVIISVLISYSSKNEKLIGFLFVHNEVFAADNSYVIFVSRELHADDLILLSGIRFEKWNLQQTTL